MGISEFLPEHLANLCLSYLCETDECTKHRQQYYKIGANNNKFCCAEEDHNISFNNVYFAFEDGEVTIIPKKLKELLIILNLTDINKSNDKGILKLPTSYGTRIPDEDGEYPLLELKLERQHDSHDDETDCHRSNIICWECHLGKCTTCDDWSVIKCSDIQ